MMMTTMVVMMIMMVMMMKQAQASTGYLAYGIYIRLHMISTLRCVFLFISCDQFVAETNLP